MAAGGPGNGPPCPIDPSHGRLYSETEGTGPQRFYCPHSAHGGNGKLFSDKEAHGEYQLKEDDVTMVLEGVARDVIAGKVTMDQAAALVARSTQTSSSQAREAVTIMIETIEGKEASVADQKKAAEAKKSVPAKAAGERRQAEKTSADEFRRVISELGLTDAQARAATGEAGMGASSAYIHILKKDGATTNLFNKFEAALRSYALRNNLGPFSQGGAEPTPEERPRKSRKAARVEPEEAEIAKVDAEIERAEVQVESDEAVAEAEEVEAEELDAAEAGEQVLVE